MKRLKLGGACVAVAILVAMAVAASAQANVRSSTAPMGPMIVAPPTLDPLTSAEVAAVARTGVPLPRAREAIAVQSAVEREDLVNQLEAALGDAFGGVWYAPAVAQLEVGVTSPAAARVAGAVAVRAGLGQYVTEAVVDSSEAELVSTQKGLSGRLAGLFAREEVTTWVSLEENSVNVELGSEVPAGERAALEAETSATPVEVVVSSASGPRLGMAPQAQCLKFEPKKAFCDPTIVAGTRLEEKNGIGCTTGPAVLSPAEPTETYVLTAGHCVTAVGESRFSFNKVAKREEVGKVKAFLSEPAGNNADVAAVKVENKFWKKAGEIPVVPAIAPWDKTKDVEPFKVAGETPPVEKAATCISAQVSGFHCGTIKATKLEIGELEEMVEVEGTKTEGGDSGAPWFSEKEKLVQGTHAGDGEISKNPLFQPLQWSFKRLKEVSKLELVLLTVKNEKRV
jgi:streptogrisin C